MILVYVCLNCIDIVKSKKCGTDVNVCEMFSIYGFKIKNILGNLYGLRTWVEYGFRQCKQELGWTDYRFTNFKDIEKWWEIIFCVYTMISLNCQAFLCLNQKDITKNRAVNNSTDFSIHQQWNNEGGWKSE